MIAFLAARTAASYDRCIMTIDAQLKARLLFAFLGSASAALFGVAADAMGMF